MNFILFVNASIFVIVVTALYFTFPKYLSELMEANRYRLDGTISQKRADIESRSLKRWRTNVIFIGFLSLALINVGILTFQKNVMPIGIAWGGLEQFSLNPDIWKENLKDGDQGDQLAKFTRWQEKQGRIEPRGREMPIHYFAYGFGTFGLTLFSFCLCRCYVSSLVQLGNRAKQRNKNYLIHDMATRIDAVEDHGTGDQDAR